MSFVDAESGENGSAVLVQFDDTISFGHFEVFGVGRFILLVTGICLNGKFEVFVFT